MLNFELLIKAYLWFVNLQGSLGEPMDVVSHITVLANDDPYGVYIIEKNSRLVYVEEGLGFGEYCHNVILNMYFFSHNATLLLLGNMSDIGQYYPKLYICDMI